MLHIIIGAIKKKNKVSKIQLKLLFETSSTTTAMILFNQIDRTIVKVAVILTSILSSL